MPSAAGKRVGRVLAGVRSQRREISPGYISGTVTELAPIPYLAQPEAE